MEGVENRPPTRDPTEYAQYQSETDRKHIQVEYKAPPRLLSGEGEKNNQEGQQTA